MPDMPQKDIQKSTQVSNGWVAVDLDGTLADDTDWRGIEHVGEPVPRMLARVKRWLAEGKTVKIFTARVSGHGLPIFQADGSVELADCKTPIEQWCLKHLGQVLEITNVKDFGMLECWDDRCVQVVPNSGIALQDIIQELQG